MAINAGKKSEHIFRNSNDPKNGPFVPLINPIILLFM